MGNEVTGTVHTGKARHAGRILLETSELIFRGADYRQKVKFSEMIDVQANDGELRIKTSDGVFIFEIGAAAEKWREKILCKLIRGSSTSCTKYCPSQSASCCIQERARRSVSAFNASSMSENRYSL